MFDLIIRRALVVDPKARTKANADVAIEDGRIAYVAESIDADAKETLDAQGLVLQPGIIDTHLHLSVSPKSHAMVVRAGVTTALDMSGPTDQILREARENGYGLNIAILNAIVPGQNVSDNNPDEKQIDRFVTESLAGGAFGVKLLGGHFPLTPEASGRMVRTAAERNVYMAWHAGTTNAGSDLAGLTEAVAICDGHPVHMAHLNAYCRGRLKPVLDECREAAALLESHPELVTESYLSARNGCPLDMKTDGTPMSAIVTRNLAALGFEPSAEGVCAAVRVGILGVLVPENDDIAVISGKEGEAYFREAVANGRHIDGSFDGVNPFASRAFFATARRTDGCFLVDGISTDGGGIPRNVIVESGLSLVKLGGLDVIDFAVKTSLLPARMLGLAGKGTLAEDADADLTIYDPVTQKARHSLVNGRFILRSGVAVGSSAQVLCTAQGVEAVRKAELAPIEVTGGIPKLDRLSTAGLSTK